MLKSNKDELLREVARKTEKALTMIGLQAQGYAQEYAHVDTGNLRNSIGTDVNMSNDSVTIGTNVEYAPFVEFGHLQEVGRFVPTLKKRLVKPVAPAYPFLRPALDEHLDEYKQIVERVFEE